jgi:hypothetical protein
MRRISAKRKMRAEEARPVREALIAERRRCEICGHSPAQPWKDKPRECSQLCVHEIANGPYRQKALDKRYATLVLCWWCNGSVVTNKRDWPEARQLACLRRNRPHDYDLVAYCRLVNERAPNRIEPKEVDAFLSSVHGV